jgi:membrane protein
LALAVAVGAATSKHIPPFRLFPSGSGLFVIIVAIFFAIYKWVPHCWVRSKFALLSALLTSVIFSLAQAGFRLYTAKVLTYSKIYGSLAAVPLLLIWIYIIWLIVLSGAALTASLQRRFLTPSP